MDSQLVLASTLHGVKIADLFSSVELYTHVQYTPWNGNTTKGDGNNIHHHRNGRSYLSRDGRHPNHFGPIVSYIFTESDNGVHNNCYQVPFPVDHDNIQHSHCRDMLRGHLAYQ